MDSKLLEYYNRELIYLREMGKEFAERYPKVANRLGMHGIDVTDPYVERLMEGFAFLTSRIQLKMDAEFPNFSQQLLEMLCPNYLAPTPSMSIAELQPDTSKGDISHGFLVPRGTIMHCQSLKKDGITLQYSTAQDVILQPLHLQKVELGKIPANIPLASLNLHQCGAVSALRIHLTCKGKFFLSELELNKLIFFLSGPDIQAQQLQELLMEHCVGMICQTLGDTPQYQVLPDISPHHEGFDDEQSLLPNDPRTFSGYRQLHEYFAFPARFQFFSISGMQSLLEETKKESEFELILLLDKIDEDLEHLVDASYLALNSTPVINLFPKLTERVTLKESTNEYHLVVDNTRPLDYEIFSVQRLHGADIKRRETQIFRPFWSTFSDDKGNYGAYFSLRRDPRILSEHSLHYGTRTSYLGTESFVSIVDEQHSPWPNELKFLTADVMCTNRDLSAMLRQQDIDSFVMLDSIPINQIVFLKRPTIPHPALAQGSASWKLISQLQLNYLNFMDKDDEQGTQALRQLLSLYANLSEPATARQINGIRHCSLKTIHRRVPEPGPIVFARGVGIELEVDEQEFAGTSPWLLGSVLERLFSHLVTMNSFTEMTLYSQQRGKIGYWPARMGKKQLL
ncbi:MULTISPECIES: type VI secretion system baseplate subunit TssF [Xenorhabdus]|uniref:Cytoplasmic protein n=1 Tax=Xenorhabdus stockiae TaxID=351614 RepID=A0A2D0KUV5_9GAMM|nr:MULTISPECIES: type VI secretion system baseplate subunit TssF [Xenorhabdus]MCC8378262.1 type VI secretion system baseplate subunit TssF [Xenorhabdus sp. PB30.3]PHM56595.1 cytoplasmic protein [Xenorhabdus sp. KK7.4]PHM67007.1 cytoplasmic protein [Xenorhabdus stockiae]